MLEECIPAKISNIVVDNYIIYYPVKLLICTVSVNTWIRI
jgi:hypothetical protein